MSQPKFRLAYYSLSYNNSIPYISTCTCVLSYEQKLNESRSIEKTVTRKRRSKNSEVEHEKYFEKYAKIVGENSGVDAAKITKSNKSYGMGKIP